ncbi:hypothetical protein [Kordiimonas sp.]
MSKRSYHHAKRSHRRIRRLAREASRMAPLGAGRAAATSTAAFV